MAANTAPTFAISDGKATTAIGGYNDFGQSVAVQSDGKLVVAGYSYNGTNYDFAVVRYNANGSLDTTFVGDGRLTTAIGSFHDLGQSVVVQADGKIIVAGYGDFGFGAEDFELVRYNANGTLDTTFDGDGKVKTDVGGQDYGKASRCSPTARSS
jgi:uncharacterized delta-60 repeat protein